jgi:preprotein translocase YajC subunit
MQILALAMGLFAEGIGSFFPRPEILLLILFAFYFIVMRPAKEEKKRRSLLEGLKKNDRVVTSSGVKAIVASVNREKNEAVLTIDKSTKAQMTVTLDSIGHVVTDEKKDENKKTETE